MRILKTYAASNGTTDAMQVLAESLSDFIADNAKSYGSHDLEEVTFRHANGEVFTYRVVHE